MHAPFDLSIIIPGSVDQSGQVENGVFHYGMPHIHLLLQQLSWNSVPFKSKCRMATLIQGSSLAPVNTDRSLGPNWPSSNSGFLLAKSLPGPTWPCSISGFLPAKSLLVRIFANKKLAWTKVANLIQRISVNKKLALIQAASLHMQGLIITMTLLRNTTINQNRYIIIRISSLLVQYQKLIISMCRWMHNL